MSMAVKTIRFCLACWRLNLAGALEFRFSFAMTVLSMMLNNAVFLFFWGVYFTRFSLVSGWQLQDVMMLWAVATTGYGICCSLFGNSTRLASMIAQGDLDPYLTQPKPILLHVLISRMNVSAIGDLLFGILLFIVFGHPSIKGSLFFTAAVLLSTCLHTAFFIGTQSLSFFIGHAEGAANQFFLSFITLSTYPSDIFQGWARFLLFTLIPAGFISWLPVRFLREANVVVAGGTAAACLLFSSIAFLLFRIGLARYSSGNRMGVRM